MILKYYLKCPAVFSSQKNRITLSGTEKLATDLRRKTADELENHAQFYVHHPKIAQVMVDPAIHLSSETYKTAGLKDKAFRVYEETKDLTAAVMAEAEETKHYITDGLDCIRYLLWQMLQNDHYIQFTQSSMRV